MPSIIQYKDALGATINLGSDLVGTKQYQYVKLMTGIAGSETPIASKATGVLKVAVVDGSDAQITSFGGGVQYAEDTAHVSGDTGTMALGVRIDALGTILTNAAADYSPFTVDNYGRMWARQASEGLADEAATESYDPTSGEDQRFGNLMLAWRNDSGAVPPNSASGGFSFLSLNATHNLRVTIDGDLKAEDVAHVSGDKGFFSLGVRNDFGVAVPGAGNTLATTFSSAAGDYTPLAVSAKGELYVKTETGAEGLGKVEDAAHVSGDTGIAIWGVRNDSLGTTFSGANGDYTPIAVNAQGAVRTLPSGATTPADAIDDDDAAVSGVVPFVSAITYLYDPVTFQYNRVRGDTTNGLDVDVTRVVPGTGATNLGKAEDAGHASGDTGVMPLAVRNDLTAGVPGTTFSNTNGDYTPIGVSAKGEVLVQVTAVFPGTGATNQGKAEDAAHTDGDTGIMSLAVRNDLTAGVPGTTFSNTNGDYTPIGVTSKGEVLVQVTAVFPGTGATNLGKAEDAAHVSGDTGVMPLAVRNDAFATALSNTDGDYTPIGSDSAGRLGTHSYAVNDYVMVAGTPLLVKQANFAITGADQSVVAAVTSKKIRVISIVFTNASAGTVTWKSNATTLISAMPFAANGGMDTERTRGWFAETASGEALKASVSAGTMVGSLCYIEVP